jgi:hypothetical protein
MRKVLIGGAAVLALAGGGAFAAAQASSPDISGAQTLHLVAPVKGSVTTPTSDLTQFRGPLTNGAGNRVGHLQGYCVTINDDTGAAECTTTMFLAGGQITLTGPTYDRDVHATFDQAVAGGTGRYQNARGQATVTLRANKDVGYLVNLIP